MAKKVRSSDKAVTSYLDVFEAIKRARIRRGRMRRPRVEENAPELTQSESEKLTEVAEKAHEVLFKTDTVFPLTMFPDTITLEREKVNIANRFFFKVAKIIHIPVRDLLNVEANVGPFFGSLHISSRFFASEPFAVNFLWKKDTLQLQRLLQGYIIAHERDIDCTNIEKKELIKLLNDLGVGDTG